MERNASLNTSSDTKLTLTGSSSTSGTLTYNVKNGVCYFDGSITSSITTKNVDGMFSAMPIPLRTIKFTTTGDNNACMEIRQDGGLRNYSSRKGTEYFSGSYVIK